MAFNELLVGYNISSSGLSAERARMEVVASNIANAFSTRSPNGGPYRRQEVLFESMLQNRVGGPAAGRQQLLGVAVAGVQDDPTAFPQIYNPGHPDANASGMVQMPNVSLPIEMVNLMTASRAYEANLKVMQSVRKQMDQVISILR